MSTETLSPDVLLTQTNLTGVVGDIQDDPDSPDGNWLTADSHAVDSICRVSFPSPADDLTGGAGLQEFRVLFDNSSGGDNADKLEIFLYEDGTVVGSAILTQINPLGGVFSGTWDANDLAAISGADVECYVYTTADTDPPPQRCSGNIGAIEWNVTYSTTQIDRDVTCLVVGRTRTIPQAVITADIDLALTCISVGRTRTVPQAIVTRGTASDISDDFSGDLSKWTQYNSSGWDINASDQLIGPTSVTSTVGVLTYSDESAGSVDQWVKVKLVNLDKYHGPLLRHNNVADCLCYFLNFSADNVYVTSVDNGGSATDEVNSSALTWAANDVVGVTVEDSGSDIEFNIWKNPSGAAPGDWGTADITLTQTSGTKVTTGDYVGLAQYGIGVGSPLDDFSGGSLAAADIDLTALPNPLSEFFREPRLLVPRKMPVGPVRIDWSRPITERLVGAWVFARPGPLIVKDLVGASDAYIGGITDTYDPVNGPRWDVSPNGNQSLYFPDGLNTDWSGKVQIAHHEKYNEGDNLTAFIKGYRGSAAADTYDNIFTKGSYMAGGAPGESDIAFEVASDSLIKFGMETISQGGDSNYVGLTFPAANTPFTFTGVYNRPVVLGYNNGLLEDTATKTDNTARYKGNFDFALGGYGKGLEGGNLDDWWIEAVFFFTRALSSSEILGLDLDPGQFLIPK